MKSVFLSLCLTVILIGCKNQNESQATSETDTPVEEIYISEDNPGDLSDSTFELTPVSHASMMIQWEGSTIYIDPVGGAEPYDTLESPDLILITDIHGDHLNTETLEAVTTSDTQILAPQAVADKLPENLLSKTQVLGNGEQTTFKSFTIDAIPMYNLREEALKFHEKGRGNGYVIEQKGERVYISGDTEDIPEMRGLEHIDRAFVCMNLPYTMPVENAADAVLEFQPTMVYPYHYRGSEGPSDVEAFKKMVHAKNKEINVVLLDWYPSEDY